MNQEKIKNKLIELVGRCTGRKTSEVGLEDKLFQKDSLSSVEMLVAIEESFAVVIHDQEIHRLHTVEDALNLIYKKRGYE